MARIVSPGRMPAVSAGPPGAGDRTTKALVPPCCGEKDTSTPTPVTDPAVLRLRGGNSRAGKMGDLARGRQHCPARWLQHGQLHRRSMSN